MNTALPPIFGLAIMIPARCWCHAWSLWINQPERSLYLNRSEADYGDPGSLKFSLEPKSLSTFLEARINPPSLIRKTTEFEQVKRRARMVVTDGRIDGWDWETSTDRHGTRTFDIVYGQSTIPVRFHPAAMDFCSGSVDVWPHDVPPAWDTATSWSYWGGDPKTISRYKAHYLTDSEQWDTYLAAAAQCWHAMEPSQVKVEVNMPSKWRPQKLRDLWKHQLDVASSFRKPGMQSELWNIIQGLASDAPPIDEPRAIEKSIHRAARRGRITPTNVRALLTLLAAGTGFQPKPRKALAN
jgi:hypothetical protein